MRAAVCYSILLLAVCSDLMYQSVSGDPIPVNPRNPAATSQNDEPVSIDNPSHICYPCRKGHEGSPACQPFRDICEKQFGSQIG